MTHPTQRGAVSAVEAAESDRAWEFADQFMRALGVRPEVVSPLTRIRAILDRWEQVDLGSPGGAGSGAGPGDEGGLRLEALSAEERALVDDELGQLLRLGLPMAEEVLARLRELGVRTEIVGFSADGLDATVADLRAYELSQRWRGADSAEIQAFVSGITTRADLRVTPVRQTFVEVHQIVTVLRAMPRRLVRRTVRTRNPLALTVMMTVVLRQLRAEGSDLDGM